MDFKSFLTVFSCLLFLGQQHALAQLSGVVNTYVKVTAVDYTCNKITVTSTTGFAANDKVLLIQMQGASIDEANTANFGDLTSIGDAGNYEFAYIDHFVNNDVYFKHTLLKTYTPSGSVQMVSVPQYTNASIDGELTATAWNGDTGGIIILECSGTLTQNANINASEKGFRGGHKSVTGGSCIWSGQNNYYFPLAVLDAGEKGESISAYITGKGSGRGKNSTGGGGGNNHNTGGGGGGNYGAGGRGGDKNNTSVICTNFAPNPFGCASLGLSSTYYNNTINRIFLGGGGGGGQQNNNMSYDAGNGGGIIIITAASLNSNGYSIKSNGGSVSSNYTNAQGDNGDGNSAGGAGGTILLDIQSNVATAPVLEAIGGKGGDTGYLNFNFGPGGGGGGGVVWTASSTVALNTNVSGGNAGISGLGGGNGSGTTWNAASGGAGGLLTNLSIPTSTSTSSCALPVELLFFHAKYTGRYTVELTWATVKEDNNAYFSLEKSSDGIHYASLKRLSAVGSSTSLNTYQHIDQLNNTEIIYYKLLQTDIDGTTTSLGVRVVYPEKEASHTTITAVYPNPFNESFTVDLATNNSVVIHHAYLVTTLGKLFIVPFESESNSLVFDTASLASGLYTLCIQSQSSINYYKVVKN